MVIATLYIVLLPALEAREVEGTVFMILYMFRMVNRSRSRVVVQGRKQRLALAWTTGVVVFLCLWLLRSCHLRFSSSSRATCSLHASGSAHMVCALT